MRTEVPVFRRCCFCIPVRYGLLIWGYLLLVPSILMVVADIFQCMYVVQYGANNSVHWTTFVRFAVTLLLKICNLVFTFLLIIAAHRKSSRLLKIYYTGGLYGVVAMFVLEVADMVFDFIDMWEYSFIWKYILWQTLAGFVYIGLQLYILAMTRSEILKLDSQHQFRFSNIAAEAECQYYGGLEKIQTDQQDDIQTDKQKDTQTEKQEAIRTDLQLKVDTKEHSYVSTV